MSAPAACASSLLARWVSHTHSHTHTHTFRFNSLSWFSASDAVSDFLSVLRVSRVLPHALHHHRERPTHQRHGVSRLLRARHQRPGAAGQLLLHAGHSGKWRSGWSVQGVKPRVCLEYRCWKRFRGFVSSFGTASTPRSTSSSTRSWQSTPWWKTPSSCGAIM